MIVRKRLIIYFVFTLFILFGLSAPIFERIFYFNEILSLAGGTIFIFKTFKANNKLFFPNSLTYKAVLFLLIWCIIQLFISITQFTSIYYYLRSSVIFYSIFSFFIGFYYYENFKLFLKKTRVFLKLYIISFLALPGSIFLERFTTALFMPLLVKSPNRIFSRVLVFILLFALAISYSSMTVVQVAILLFTILILKNFTQFKLVFVAGVLVFSFFFYNFSSNLSLYNTGRYQLYGQKGGIDNVVKTHKIFQLDYNSTWRAVFWYRVVVENYPKNLIGIGFGTPLIYYKIGAHSSDSKHSDEYDAHVTGCHNTYLTLFVRLGIPFIVFLLIIYYYVMNFYYSNRKLIIEKNDEGIFWAFFIVTIIGLFNLFLETGTAASIYWILLGFVSKIIYNSVNETNSVAQSPHQLL
jgi:hypothetical protein